MKIKRNFMTTSSNSSYITPYIPNREEQHRYISNYLTLTDFCTDFPSGTQADKVLSALKWSQSNNKFTKALNRYKRKGVNNDIREL